METKEIEWRTTDEDAMQGPSLDFIRAVAKLLETDADDILAELGYSHPDMRALAVVEI